MAVGDALAALEIASLAAPRRALDWSCTGLCPLTSFVGGVGGVAYDSTVGVALNVADAIQHLDRIPSNLGLIGTALTHLDVTATVAADDIGRGVDRFAGLPMDQQIRLTGDALLAGGGAKALGARLGAGVEANSLSWAQMSGQLRSAAAGKGNFGIGSGTGAYIDDLGHAWVGSGATKSVSNPGILISSDGLRMFRPPAFKPGRGAFQANLQWRPEQWRIVNGQWEPFAAGPWIGNAHIDLLP
jgi:hypothetical protein